MPSINPASSLRVAVLNPQGQPLGSTVDLRLQPRAGGEAIILNNQDASKEIEVRGLQPGATYDLTVTPSAGGLHSSIPVSVSVSGLTPIKIVVGSSNQPPSHTLGGTLIFDHGMPAANVHLLLYSIGFGGQGMALAKAQSDAQGKYSFSYAPPGAGGAADPTRFQPAINLQVRALDPAGKEVTLSSTKYNT